MSKIFTPVNQTRLTNVAVVRYKKKGKRFEIACYKNKVLSWRNKVEKDIDEVLQSHRVFTNVSKGVLAKTSDLKRCFGTEDEEEICLLILAKGNLQISAKERAQEAESKMKDLITTIANKCVSSETRRPFPVSIIENALKEIGFHLKQNRSAKQQAGPAIEALKEVLPIVRAQMRLRLCVPSKSAKALKKELEPLFAEIEVEEWTSGELELVGLIDPGSYRPVDELFNQHAKGRGSLEILDMTVREEGSGDL